MQLPLLMLLGLVPAQAYHILCIQTVASTSHYSIMFSIVKPLLEDGHEVTFITTYPERNTAKNLHIIDVSPVKRHLEELHKPNVTITMADVVEFASVVVSEVLHTPAVREMLISAKLDLVISEWFFSDVEAGYSAVLQVPWILLSGMVLHPHLENLVDTVRSLVIAPAMFKNYPTPLNFQHRLLNTATYLLSAFNSWNDFSSSQSRYEALFVPLARARGVALAPYGDAIHDMSILFVNSHTTHAPPLSLPPNVVNIGGYHIDDHTPPLPQDLQIVLDSSPQGVIYFSMGSVIKADTLSATTRSELLKLFSRLAYTVVWKFDAELQNVPDNVHVRPWVQQSSILAHPNVKVFITHGGLLSTLESLHFGVPLIVVPVFGDQFANAQRAVEGGYALKIPFSPEMAKDLSEPLKEILSNERFYQKAKHLSKLFVNRPVPPRRLIQYYTNLTIETKGAPHLRSKALLYRWYELWMLDQVAFVLVIAYIINKTVKSAYRSICTFKDEKVKLQ